MNKHISKIQILAGGFFAFYLVWWTSFQGVVKDQGISVQRFGATYGIMALFGAVIGVAASIKWGGFKTLVGRALLFFSLGLLLQESGQIIYTYYIYGAKVQIPYPSWGDLAYFGSVIMYIYAALLLGKSVGIKYSLRKTTYKVIAVIVPLVILAATFWVFLHNHTYDLSQPLTVFLDFGYPIGQAIYISLALIAYLLSRKMLGGMMRKGILIIIFALVMQYVSDFTFLYQSSRGTWLTGQWNDLSYLVSYFVMTMAMIAFLKTFKNLKKQIGVAPVTDPIAAESKV